MIKYGQLSMDENTTIRSHNTLASPKSIASPRSLENTPD